MAIDIAHWLEGLGLGQYAQAFADNDVDFEVLPDLTDDELRELGLSLGHRKKLLRAIGNRDKRSSAPETGPKTNQAQASQECPSLEAERRQVTVLFCDLVGSTALSSRLDPEDMRELLRTYQVTCAGVIARYDGYIAKFMGDGVYAYFGYPMAHEDDAERAIRAGLELSDAVPGLSMPDTQSQPVAVRIGIATGTVVIGDLLGEGAAEEAAVTGEAPNLAARLQEIAAPNAVVTAAATHRLAGRAFECRNMGEHSFRGFDLPVSVWVVVGLRPTETRFEALYGEEPNALVGREEELDIIKRRWARAKDGEGQVAVISGEPGIGKSRLVRALTDEIGDDRRLVVWLQCSPYHTNSALYPLIEQMERAIGFEPGEDDADKCDKLEAWLALADENPAKVGPLYASLFGIEARARWPSPDMSTQRQKELTLQAVVDRTAAIAERDPIVLVVEDAHWIDPTTLELLDLMIDRATVGRLLIVVTCRPEFSPLWTGRAHVTILHLNRLSRRECAALTDGISGAGKLPQALRDQIIEKTDGVPLFVEELTKAVIEGEINELSVPATLQDSLEARLDGLGPAKEIAQIGAVIGREFGHGLLAQLAPMTAPGLDEAVSRLVQSELVFRHGQPPNATYTFKHALVQDTAYASLLRGRRRELHGRVADVLERQFPETVAAEPDLLFHHCAEAGRVVNAAHYAVTAADVAVGRASWGEADAQLAAALQIVTTMAHSRERDALELDLQVARTWTVRPLYSPAHERHEAILLRARDLCDDVGNHAQMSQILFGLCIMHTWRANIDQALKDSRRLMQIAEDSQDRSQLLHANAVLGHALWHNGNNVDAEVCFGRLEVMYEPTIDLRHAHAPGLFHERVHGAATRFTLGYPDRAVALAESAYASVSESDERMTAMAVFQASAIRAWRGEPEMVLSWIEPRLARWQETQNRVFLAAGNILRSWALSRLGRIPDGPARIMEGIEQYNALNLRAWIPAFSVFLAELQIADGKTEAALRTADETLARIYDTDERQFESPALAVKGDAIRALTPSDVTAAERCYGDSIEIAQSQSAKSWELRAATHLACLWHSQGKTTDARDLLAPVYGWFTEGFETADLKDAKTLLDELG